MILAPFLIIAAFVGLITVNEAKAVEMKKVCHQVKTKQVCKTIKVHKKLNGTIVPPKPVKKPSVKKK
jgi:hypothetical protein